MDGLALLRRARDGATAEKAVPFLVSVRAFGAHYAEVAVQLRCRIRRKRLPPFRPAPGSRRQGCAAAMWYSKAVGSEYQFVTLFEESC